MAILKAQEFTKKKVVVEFLQPFEVVHFHPGGARLRQVRLLQQPVQKHAVPFAADEHRHAGDRQGSRSTHRVGGGRRHGQRSRRRRGHRDQELPRPELQRGPLRGRLPGHAPGVRVQGHVHSDGGRRQTGRARQHLRRGRADQLRLPGVPEELDGLRNRSAAGVPGHEGGGGVRPHPHHAERQLRPQGGAVAAGDRPGLHGAGPQAVRGGVEGRHPGRHLPVPGRVRRPRHAGRPERGGDLRHGCWGWWRRSPKPSPEPRTRTRPGS